MIGLMKPIIELNIDLIVQKCDSGEGSVLVGGSTEFYYDTLANPDLKRGQNDFGSNMMKRCTRIA